MLLGPGLVYVLTVLGGGDVVSNAAAGAGYGYSLIWTLGITLVFRFVWVDISAKYVLVTGESLLQGYARVGKWVIWTLLIALIVVGHSYNLYAIVMIGRRGRSLVSLAHRMGQRHLVLFFYLRGICNDVLGRLPSHRDLCQNTNRSYGRFAHSGSSPFQT